MHPSGLLHPDYDPSIFKGAVKPKSICIVNVLRHHISIKLNTYKSGKLHESDLRAVLNTIQLAQRV